MAVLLSLVEVVSVGAPQVRGGVLLPRAIMRSFPLVLLKLCKVRIVAWVALNWLLIVELDRSLHL